MLRTEFDLACRALIAQYKDAEDTLATTAMKNWIWNEHDAISGLGYMSRRTTHVRRTPLQKDIDNDDLASDTEHVLDDAAAIEPALSTNELLTCHQYVVFSATFQVPAFYFSMHNSNGSPLTLSELVETTLFRSPLVDGTARTSFGLTNSGSTFPLLSQGDHPTLGTACWYFHPCETAGAVDELLPEGSSSALQWLEKWFVVLGTAVNTRL